MFVFVDIIQTKAPLRRRDLTASVYRTHAYTQVGEARANSADAPPPARPPILETWRASRNARCRRPQRALLPGGESYWSPLFHQSGVLFLIFGWSTSVQN